MPEEAPQAPETPQDTPDSAPVQTDTATDEPKGSEPSVNWEQRYADLQPEYTRATQEAAELRQQHEQVRTALAIAQDPEHPQYNQALELLGFEAPDEDSDEFEDETDALAKRLERLEGTLAESAEAQEYERLQDAEDTWLAQNLEALQEREGREFTDEELRLLVATATQNRLEDGQPDLEGAHKALSAAWDNRQKSWRESKRAPQAPSGASAASDVNLDDKEQRQAYMLRRAQELDLV